MVETVGLGQRFQYDTCSSLKLSTRSVLLRICYTHFLYFIASYQIPHLRTEAISQNAAYQTHRQDQSG